MQRNAVLVYVDQLWQANQKIISDRFMLALALSLNDIYHFGDKRLSFVLKGVEDILKDYAEQSFTPSEGRNGSIDNGDYDPMAARMQEELSSRRGISFKIVNYEVIK
jgi:hypothetical protein